MNSNYDKLVHGEYCFELPSVILSLVPSLFWKVKWSEFRGALHIVTKHFSWKLDTLEGKSLCYVIFYNDPAYISKNNFSVNFPFNSINFRAALIFLPSNKSLSARKFNAHVFKYFFIVITQTALIHTHVLTSF